ncbi:MAG: hypothetical protein KKA79_02765, partial [Nanoarchaeota archaeon]|nr:hypothetical protein [Nanoarchaeota archaeon]
NVSGKRLLIVIRYTDRINVKIKDKMIFHKKGQSEVLTITLLFEVLAGFLLAGILIYATFTTSDVEGFSANYLQADHDFLISTIKALPGDIELDYETGGYRYENGKFYKGSLNQNYIIKIKKIDGEISEVSERK